jgi:hypothetical protein
VLNYLYSTKDLVISFTTYSSTTVDVYLKALSFSLHAYSDALFADAKDCKSTSSYLFKFVGSIICYCLSKQKLVTTLTTKAEYVSLTYTAKEAT